MFSVVPEQPVSVQPDLIDQNLEQWLDAWTKAVLR
jgi:ABC-type thiamine transport system substrate-binding protein